MQDMDILKRENELLRLEVDYHKRKLAEAWNHHSSEHAGCSFSPLTPPPSTRGSEEAPEDGVSADEPQVHALKRPRPCEDSRDQPAAQGAQSGTSTATHELCNSTDNLTAKSNSTKKPTRAPRWRCVADRLIAATPVSKNWWARIDSMKLGDVLQGGSGIQFLLDKNSNMLQSVSGDMETCGADDADEGRLLPVVSEYARITAARTRTIGSTLRLLNIQTFIVVCSCAVAAKVLPSKRHQKRLYDITRSCFGKDITEVYIQRLWRTGIYLNEFIDWLASQGMGPRAALLLLIWDLPPGSYVPLMQKPEAAFQYLRQKLSAEEFIQDVELRPGWMVLSFPELIYQALNKEMSTHQIGHHLKYRYTYRMKFKVNPWTFFMQHWRLDSGHIAAPSPRIERTWRVGRGVSGSLLSSLRDELVTAARHHDFSTYDSVPFVYEQLEGNDDAVKRVVDEWINDPENIRRAALVIGISELDTREMVLHPTVQAFCGFRFKKHHPIEEGGYPVEGLAAIESGGSVIVMIALEPLGPENGCFVNLESGQDVCIDGHTQIEFPGTGGGLGMFFEISWRRG